MALTVITGGWKAWVEANRIGPAGVGTPYSCLVSDLIADDYLYGSRATIVTIGASTGTPAARPVTLRRLGHEWSTTLVTASSVFIVRP